MSEPSLVTCGGHSLQLLDMASREVACLAATHSLGEAAEIMATRRISSIVVTDERQHPLGIVTERDIVKAMQDDHVGNEPLRTVMSAPVVSVPAGMPCEEAYHTCLSRGIRHLVLVDAAGTLAGVVSETDFRLHMSLSALAGHRKVASIMTREVLSLPVSASLKVAIEHMQEMADTCVVAVDAGVPVGIVTERDVVRLFAGRQVAANLTLAEVMATPLRTVGIDTSVSEAANLMLQSRIRHLVVVGHEGHLAGLISEHDLTQTMAYGLIDSRLDAERRFLHTLVDTIPDLVWLKDPQGVYLACNPRFELLYGASEADIVGKTDYDFVDREQADSFRAHDLKALAKGAASVNEEWLTFAADGHRELVETIKTPMRDSSGQVIGVLGVARDISALRRLQLALADREDLYQAIFRQAANGIELIDMQTLRFVDVNEAACRMLGYSREQYLGMRLADIQADMDEAQLRAAVASIAAQGGAVFQNRHRHRDGKVLAVEISASVLDLHGQQLLVGVWQDITARVQAEKQLRLAASVFANSQEGILITDADNRIVEVNPAFSKVTGYSREEVLGKDPALLRSGRQAAEFYSQMWSALHSSGQWRGEIWNRRKSGEEYPEILSISLVRDEQSGQISHVGVFSDISQLKAHEAELDRIAHYDPLTGVPNRLLLSDRLGQALSRARRSGRPLAVCYLDLDGFKPVNDQFGHEIGDRLLIEVTRHLQGALRAGDTLARLGGDEFVLLFNDLASDQECFQALQRVLSAAARTVDLGGDVAIKVSASVGVTLFPNDDADADTLLRHADQAMYRAKEAGRNRYHLFDPEHDRQIKAHYETLQCMRQALEQQEFRLHYQPKVDMVSGEVLGVEALLRWQHPERGLLLPGEFLHYVDNTDLEVGIGEWVIAQALQQLADWRRQGLRLQVSINISAHHLQRPDFSERLRQALARQASVQPGDLQMEILESAAIDDFEHASRTLRECIAMGVEFALDDFGTGYSSLSYFRRLPVKLLKIDQGFVRDMLDDPEDLGIVETVVHLTRTFNRAAIAEGVESLQHGTLLVQLGCYLGQGFGIARPMQAETIPQWLAGWQGEQGWRDAAEADLGSDGVMLLVAAASHRKWMHDLAAYLHGQRQSPPALSADACRFGHWYQNAGRGQFRNLPEFKQLDAPHRQIHALAAELVAMGRGPRSQAALAELEAHSEGFIAAIGCLVERVRLTGPGRA